MAQRRVVLKQQSLMRWRVTEFTNGVATDAFSCSAEKAFTMMTDLRNEGFREDTAESKVPGYYVYVKGGG
jgi:hypothetical protein